jgi:CRP/FNR family cyclic AMP-dependent transcriptional regulator
MMLNTFNTNHQNLVPRTLALPTRRLSPGATLYEADRNASFLYIVDEGLLKALVPTTLANGERIAELYGPGDVIGIAALTGGEHGETVVAIQDTSLTPVDPDFAMNDAKLRDYIMESLASQLNRSREALQEEELPVGARVTRAFIRLAERFGQENAEGEGVMLPLSLTHEDLAALVGSSRVTITRVLGELRNEGVLSGTRGTYIAIPAGLEAATEHYVAQVR